MLRGRVVTQRRRPAALLNRTVSAQRRSKCGWAAGGATNKSLAGLSAARCSLFACQSEGKPVEALVDTFALDG